MSSMVFPARRYDGHSHSTQPPHPFIILEGKRRTAAASRLRCGEGVYLEFYQACVGSWFQEGVGAAQKSRQLYQACAGSWSQEDLGCSGFLQPRSRSSRSNDVTKATWGHRGACGAGIEPPMLLKTGKTARISALPSPLNFKKVNSPSESDGEITQLKLCRAPANHENGGYGHGAGYCDGGNGGDGGPRRQRRQPDQ